MNNKRPLVQKHTMCEIKRYLGVGNYRDPAVPHQPWVFQTLCRSSHSLKHQIEQNRNQKTQKKKRKEDRGGTINDGWMGADRASLADQLLVSWQKVVRPKGRVQAQQKRRVLGKTQLFLLFVELT